MKLFFLFAVLSYAQVDPPNYNFSLDQFDPFLPGQKFSSQWKQQHQAVLMSEKNNIQLYRLQIKQLRYVFSIFVGVKENIIVDFYATLPTYFLHDVFHQSLINRFQKQDEYQLINGTALYTWKKNPQKKMIYSATCTITCFPIFLTVFNETVTGPHSLYYSLSVN